MILQVPLYSHLGGGNSNIFGIFTPKIGEDEPNLIKYFSDGWFNHQPVMIKPPGFDPKCRACARRTVGFAGHLRWRTDSLPPGGSRVKKHDSVVGNMSSFKQQFGCLGYSFFFWGGYTYAVVFYIIEDYNLQYATS